MCFSSCFICLKKAPKQFDSEVKKEVELKRKDKSKDINLTNFLASYLLQTRANTHDQVLNDVLNFNGGGNNVIEEGSSKGLFQLCEGCGAVAGKIVTFHLAQEKLRIQIAKEVNAVRETILRSSGWLGGGISNSEDDESTLKNFSKKFWEGDGSSNRAKKLFHTLKTFQTAVNKNNELEYIGTGLLPFGNCGIRAYHVDRIQMHIQVRSRKEKESVLDAVKTESEEQGDQVLEESFQKDFFDERHDDDNTKERQESEEVPIPMKKSKMSSRRKPNEKSTEVQKTVTTPMKSPVSPVPSIEVTKEQNEPHSKTINQKRRTYTCETCNYRSQNTIHFERHLRKHETDVKCFQCDQCDLKFSTEQTQKFHKRRAHRGFIVGKHKVKCTVCSVHVKRSEYDAHLESHGEKTFPCPYCIRRLSSVEKYMEHICRSHDGGDLKCKICGMLLQTKMLLMKHLDEIHNAITKVKCDAEGCQKSFMSHNELYHHKSHTHTGPSICEVCAKCFENRGKLDAHLRIHYKPVKCDHCPSTFQGRDSLQAHMVRDHGIALFVCKTCGKSCTSAKYLKRHKLSVHNEGTWKICPICNKKFSTSSQLKVHGETHSTTQNYVCAECGKCFRTSHGLKTHRTIHGKKNHQCSYCPKAFTRSQILTEHLRTHTGERPFECDHCGKSFNQRGARNLHMKRCPQRASAETQA